MKNWCQERELNPYRDKAPRDFKSLASTCSAILAYFLRNKKTLGLF